MQMHTYPTLLFAIPTRACWFSAVIWAADQSIIVQWKEKLELKDKEIQLKNEEIKLQEQEIQSLKIQLNILK